MDPAAGVNLVSVSGQLLTRCCLLASVCVCEALRANVDVICISGCGLMYLYFIIFFYASDVAWL